MKCPKCLYIGFETGDRCKNCGYDFSHMEERADTGAADRDVADLFLRDDADQRTADHDRVMTLGEPWPVEMTDRFRDLPAPEAAPHTAPVWTLGAVTQTVAPVDSPLPAGPAASKTASVSTVPPLAMLPPVQALPPPSVASVAALKSPLLPAPARAVPNAVSSAEPPSALRRAPVASAPAPPAMSLAMDDTPALPLFEPDGIDDEPLVTLPAVLRVPLSVRKTPDAPRFRHVPPVSTRAVYDDAVLEFSEEPNVEHETGVAPRLEPVVRPRVHMTPADAANESWDDVSPIRPRLVAALIDYGILVGIDATVLYFTLRLTDLAFADWRMLPLLPMLVFLLSLKIAYFCAFTAAGGQTIGKMATHIRVIAEDDGRLDAGRSLRRALLGLASVVTFGGPFIPALVDPAHRGAHDRASGTRVIALSPR